MDSSIREILGRFDKEFDLDDYGSSTAVNDKVKTFISHEMFEYGLQVQKKTERKYYTSYPVGCMDVLVRIRGDGDDEIQQLRYVVTKEEIRQSRGKILRLGWEEAFAKFAAGSAIFKHWSGLTNDQKTNT